jgi:hypothetical protein
VKFGFLDTNLIKKVMELSQNKIRKYIKIDLSFLDYDKKNEKQ